MNHILQNTKISFVDDDGEQDANCSGMDERLFDMRVECWLPLPLFLLEFEWSGHSWFCK